MHLKLKVNKKDSLDSGQKRLNRKSQNMASSLVNDDEDNATSTTRNTQQQQQQNNSNNNSNNSSTNCLNQQNNNTATKMHGNEAKLKKENLHQRKQELEKLLNEKSWLLQQLQKQETEILNGNFEYMNFNDFISNLAVQYKQEQTTDAGSTAGGVSQFSANEEAILRRKPLTAKENHQQLQHNVLHRRQSEISNRSSEYDNYPHHDTLSTHSDGAASGAGRSGAGTMTMHQAQQAQQQYNAKSALKKRSATVAGTTQQQSVANLQMLRQQQQQQHLEQQMQQQHAIYKQHHYHHPQQHLFKQHIEHHQVLMPHLQYATQKFYYTTLQPQTQSQNPQQQQPQYGRYIKSQTLQQHTTQQQHQQQHQQQQQQSPQQQQQLIHVPQNAQQQSPTRNQQHTILYTTNQMPTHQQQQQLLLTPPHGSSSSAANMDNISLYSLNSNNVATLHRQAQQQLPIIVQCDKYYLSPTTHHVSHNDGGGFIKSSQNIKEYISPLNSPQHHGVIMVRDRKLASQTNLNNRGPNSTPSIDAISLAPSYVSMETVDYMTSPTTSQQQQHHHPPNMRWRSQTNLPPSSSSSSTVTGEMKSHSSDMLNNNHYYHTSATNHLPPQVTQVKPFKPLDEISINSYTSDTQKKNKPKQWMESSLDGPVIRQTPQHMDNNDNIQQTQRSKLSSQSLNTSRHYSMSAAQAKPVNSCINNNGASTKLSQSTSYLNQLEATQPSASSISQAYNVESTSPQNTTSQAYKYLPNPQVSNKPPPRPPLYINAGSGGGSQHYQAVNVSPSGGALTIATSPAMGGMSSTSALSPDIRIESPKNMTVVQPATFQPYKEVTKPFEMSDFYKYSTKYRQKENNNATAATQPQD